MNQSYLIIYRSVKTWGDISFNQLINIFVINKQINNEFQISLDLTLSCSSFNYHRRFIVKIVLSILKSFFCNCQKSNLFSYMLVKMSFCWMVLTTYKMEDNNSHCYCAEVLVYSSPYVESRKYNTRRQRRFCGVVKYNFTPGCALSLHQQRTFSHIW